MSRLMPRRDVPDEHIRTKDGVVPMRWAERVAIAIHEGGLSEREAIRLANMELANEAAHVPEGRR